MKNAIWTVMKVGVDSVQNSKSCWDAMERLKRRVENYTCIRRNATVKVGGSFNLIAREKLKIV
jgi:hypothetical protein